MSLATLRGTPGSFLGPDGLIHTAPAGVVRWDYSTGQPVALNEPAATELCAYREAIGDSRGWTRFGGTTATLNAAPAPDGSNNASLITPGTGGHGIYSQSFLSIAAGQTGTIAVWLRSVTGTSTVRRGLTNSIANQFGTVTLTTAWQRFSLSYTAPSAATGFNLQLDSASAPFYAWGGSIQFGGLTSYIPQAMGNFRAADALYTLPDPPYTPTPAYSDDDFLAAFQALLPTGPIWPRDPDAVQTQALRALVPTYTRQAARAGNLLADAFPVAPVELLPEWESTLGLPDPCAGPSPTLQQRQQQVAARFVAGGGQSVAYFVQVAAALGYAITITQFAPFRVGHPVGQPLYGAAWAHAWQVNAPTFTIERFEVGRDTVGEPLASWGNTVLQCEMQRLSPAHTTLLFSYA